MYNMNTLGVLSILQSLKIHGLAATPACRTGDLGTHSVEAFNGYTMCHIQNKLKETKHCKK